MRMSAKSPAFTTTADAHLVSSAEDWNATNGLRMSTAGAGRLPRVQPLRARIGEFEVDLRTGELRAGATSVRLQEQPFQILRMLLGHDGEIVTRDEIQDTLWADGTIVDFAHSINAAIKKLRQGLGDSADDPHYIETVARRGYRLMLPVQWSQPVEADRSPESQVRSRRLSPQDTAHLAEDEIVKHRPRRTFDVVTLGAPRASRPWSRGARPEARKQFTVAMQHRELEDRLLLLERLVLKRVRGLRRRQRCLFRPQT